MSGDRVPCYINMDMSSLRDKGRPNNLERVVGAAMTIGCLAVAGWLANSEIARFNEEGKSPVHTWIADQDDPNSLDVCGTAKQAKELGKLAPLAEVNGADCIKAVHKLRGSEIAVCTITWNGDSYCQPISPRKLEDKVISVVETDNVVEQEPSSGNSQSDE